MSICVGMSEEQQAELNRVGGESDAESNALDARIKSLHIQGLNRSEIARELNMANTSVTNKLSRLARHGEIVLRGRAPTAMEMTYQ